MLLDDGLCLWDSVSWKLQSSLELSEHLREMWCVSCFALVRAPGRKHFDWSVRLFTIFKYV